MPLCSNDPHPDACWLSWCFCFVDSVMQRYGYPPMFETGEKAA
jgi:hypothetical protein